MTEFTPFESTVGGVLIGLSAGGVLLHHGRIAGLSGMLNGMHNASDKDDFLYKALYLGGLVLGSAAMTATGLGMAVNLDAVDIAATAIGAALCGAGAKIAHGCTSGHGVCGLGRASQRSVVAISSFLISGALTAHVLYGKTGVPFGLVPTRMPTDLATFAVTSSALIGVPLIALYGCVQTKMVKLSQFILGGMFGMGLSVSGMTDPMKHIGFLTLTNGQWDPSLACVMGGGVIVSFLSYAIKNKTIRPHLAERFQVPTNVTLEKSLVIGGTLFGIGWALGAMCPGPALGNLSTFSVVPLVWIGATMLGNSAGGFLQSKCE